MKKRVSIHTPTWGVTLRSPLMQLVRMFQSTHLHEVWLPNGMPMLVKLLFQSTHLHEVWLPLFVTLTYNNQFQSTHLHEVWQNKSNKTCRIKSFNPHTYMRCDSNPKLLFLAKHVSIHTPTWGVTPVRARVSRVRTTFQSTHLHEVWLSVGFWVRYCFFCFNPHTYMRCDDETWFKIKDEIVSIHTPTWGVTSMPINNLNKRLVSIHTPTWGVTQLLYNRNPPKNMFQSTHLHEVWPGIVAK